MFVVKLNVFEHTFAMIIRWLILSIIPQLSFAWSQCFDKTANHVLLASAKGKPKRISLERCMKMCLDSNGGCRSFIYFNRINVCIMNAVDRAMRPDRFVTSREGVDYYHRTCYHSPPNSLALWSRDDPLIDSCFQVIQGKVLIGIVDQLLDRINSMSVCQKSCLDAKKMSGIVCKSAMWYPKEKECIIASQDKSDIAELYIDDPNSFYLENKCVDGVVKTDQGMATTAMTMMTTTSAPPPISLPSILGGASQSQGGDDEVPEEEPFHVEGELPMSLKPSGIMEIPSLPPAQQPPPIEQSGYDMSKLGVNAQPQSELMAPKNVPTIDPKVIDSYQMPMKKEELAIESKSPNDYAQPKETYQTPPPPKPTLGIENSNSYQMPPPKPSFGIETPSMGGYRRRRLSDDRIQKCFNEILPKTPMTEGRVMKAYSLEQCADICRLCQHCVRGQRCETFAFDLVRENCGVSAKSLGDRGKASRFDLKSKHRETIVYFARNHLC